MSADAGNAAGAGATGGRELVHQGFVYDTDEEFLTAAVPFLRGGVQAGETAVAVVGPSCMTLLRDALGADADGVELVGNIEWYQHPARTLAAYRDRLRVRPGRSRVIGEVVWSGRSAVETTEWQRYESVINAALAGEDAWIVCTYDRRALPEDVVTGALRTHPRLVAGGTPPPGGTPHSRPSPAYVEPAAFASGCDRRPLPPRPAAPALRFSGTTDLSRVRRFVSRQAAAAGLARERAAELVHSVNEVATNAVEHGAGGGDLHVWAAEGALVCEVSDAGRWPGPALAGYLPPDRAAASGGGLWLARLLCDRLDIRTGPSGSTVRLHVTLPDRARGRAPG